MFTKKPIHDVTFLFPVRVESIHRLENLAMTIEFIGKFFETNFRVLEAAPYSNGFLSQLLPDEVQIDFVEDFDPIFHRTHYINQLVDRIETPIAAIWDSDVLIRPESILRSIQMIREQEADFVFPYKDRFLDTSLFVRELYLQTRDFNILTSNEGKMSELYGPDPVGGAFIVNRQSYIDSGKENENFYGWGREDGERVNRWKTLGYQLERVEGYLYHLSHDRGVNSNIHSSKQHETKGTELRRLALMSRSELEKEIETWNWK